MKKIAILLSGGIDSLVAAQLLKDAGTEIFGIHFITGYEKKSIDTAALSGEDLAKRRARHGEVVSNIVSHLSEQLKIPIHILDCSRDFQQEVVDYFVRSYQQGMTPSPCLICNPAIKFTKALSFARELGATHLATGHYACVTKDDIGTYRLFRGGDHRKDQSYFLARLNQDALGSAVFPLCGMPKTGTVQFAALKKLQPAVRQESQDICFIKEGHYGDFLKAQPGFTAHPGVIEDVRGRVIGEHPGLHCFTIGQRKGINCPAAEPYYVIKIDARNNKLIVGFKKETYSQACLVKDINWIHNAPDSPIRAHTRIRYRHQAALSQITPKGRQSAVVTFDQPQNAVTPGQAAVFYGGDEVLGGGWIAAQHP